MTTYSKKDIILVPFPFSELTYAKKRPALILATIPTRDELICMMLTSTKNIDPYVDISALRYLVWKTQLTLIYIIGNLAVLIFSN